MDGHASGPTGMTNRYHLHFLLYPGGLFSLRCRAREESVSRVRRPQRKGGSRSRVTHFAGSNITRTRKVCAEHVPGHGESANIEIFLTSILKSDAHIGCVDPNPNHTTLAP